jgi:predicted DNA-binding antitoxin AbrB/MazE fold protein
MKAIEVVQENGVLKLPAGVSLPARARLAVLVLEPDEPTGMQITGLAEASGAFDFLKEEPEVYSDSDILPGRSNPRFRK